jgi:dihydroflavonol-4-reductase
LKVLVTGASGTPGSQLSRHLVEKGFSVRALLDPDEGAVLLDGLEHELAPGSVLDPESLQDSLHGVQAVFHCDSENAYWPPRDAGEPSRTVDGTRNLLVAMARVGVEGLVHIGTAFSFAPGTLEEPGDESAPERGEFGGLACLAAARSAQESVIRYSSDGRLRCVVVNPTLTMGADTTGCGPVTALIEYVASGRRYYPPGGVNVVAADDVARAALRALGRGSVGSCYIVGGANMSYRELMGKIAATLGVPAPQRQADEKKMISRGKLGSLRGKLTGRRPYLTPGLALASAMTLYYSSEKASNAFDYSPGTLNYAIEEACRFATSGS